MAQDGSKVRLGKIGFGMSRNVLTRCLAALALVMVYSISLIGSSIVLVASTTTADAQRGRGGGGRGGGGRGRGGGFRGGGFRGGGFRGRGRGFGFAPGCFYGRYGRLICPY